MNSITMKMQADKLIRMALQEDITSEDVSTNAVMRSAVKGTDGYKRQLLPEEYQKLMTKYYNDFWKE